MGKTKVDFQSEFYLHEAMHTTCIFSDMVEKHVCDHPSVRSNKMWKSKADKAALLLAELYQDIAEKDLK